MRTSASLGPPQRRWEMLLEMEFYFAPHLPLWCCLQAVQSFLTPVCLCSLPPPLPPQHATAPRAAEPSWRMSVKLKREMLNARFNLIISTRSPGLHLVFCLNEYQEAHGERRQVSASERWRFLRFFPKSTTSLFSSDLPPPSPDRPCPFAFAIAQRFFLNICALTW